MYRSEKKVQALFKDFFHLGTKIHSENKWLRLAGIIPWEKMDEMYGRYFSDYGRPAKDSRLICGLLIVKYIKDLSDEEAIEEFRENPYIQAFCGREYYIPDIQISAGILSERRKRLGKDFFDFLGTEVAKILREQKFIKVKSSRPRKQTLFA
ncbi:MAG: transposase, partial [Elusimicrobia bacterium]|nr:transposase [Elusimicrobiota bacterium]